MLTGQLTGLTFNYCLAHEFCKLVVVAALIGLRWSLELTTPQNIIKQLVNHIPVQREPCVPDCHGNDPDYCEVLPRIVVKVGKPRRMRNPCSAYDQDPGSKCRKTGPRFSAISPITPEFFFSESFGIFFPPASHSPHSICGHMSLKRHSF